MVKFISINRSLIICASLLTFYFVNVVHSTGQKDLTWEVLSDVTFDIEYDEVAMSYWMAPDFSDDILAFRGVQVIIEGYFIQMDTEDNVHVLSRYPYASCFFCGGAGPESVIELQMAKKVVGIRMDQRVRVEGTLQLNESDLNHFHYIIEDARFFGS